LTIIASAATGASAWLMGKVVNSVLQANDQNDIIYVGLIVIAVFSIKGFATYGSTVTLSLVGNSLVASIQKRVFKHLLNLQVEYYDQTTLGEVFTRANIGVAATRSIIEVLVMTAARDVLTLLFLTLVMFLQQPAISLVILLIGPISFLFLRSIVRKTRLHARKQLNDIAASTSLLKETVSGIFMIKTYSLEQEMFKRMDSVIDSMKTRGNRIAKLRARTSPIMESLGGITLGLLVIYAGLWIANNGKNDIDPDVPGQLMSFITAFLLAYAPAKKLASIRVRLEGLIVNVKYTQTLLDNQNLENLRFMGNKNLKVHSGNIKLDNISFDYGNDVPVLKDVNLYGKSGETIGLVGPSGGGKSTIFKLMLTLYLPNSGTISIDGQNIFDCKPESVRDAISYVGQESHIFTGSILENIQFGKLNATNDDIINAAKLANAHDFITSFNSGYNTFVGENGAQLSGGQRQRIAIARAFLKDAPIVLLDEATSSLDTESEKAIQAALGKLVQGKTTFIIAHRLSTVQKCDRIYVVENGRIVEEGNHDQLLDIKGVYSQLFKLQFT